MWLFCPTFNLLDCYFKKFEGTKMEANQLVVIDIQGSAGVVLDDGSIRALNVGDIITVGDLVVTAIKSSLQIDVQGETLSIPANQKVKITPDLLAKEARDSSETTVFDESLDEAIASLDLGAEQDPSTAANSDVTDFHASFFVVRAGNPSLRSKRI